MIVPDGFVLMHVTDDDLNQRQLALISRHTTNTWQPGRSADDLAADTKVGKLAEHTLEVHLQQHGVKFFSWDMIRQDGFKTHAPVDGFIMKRGTLEHLDFLRFVSLAHTSTEATHFTTDFRDEIETNGVFGFEIKSTRVTGRLRSGDGSLNRQVVLGDDFLVYPSTRSGELTPDLCQRLMQQSQIDMVESRTPCVQFRAYVDSKGSEHRVYLVRYISRDAFFSSTSFTVKTMRQPGKSERAIYYAVPLRNGRSLSDIIRALGVESPTS